MKRFILFAAALTACKWTDFDDLSNQTWAHSQSKPSIGSTDYAVSIVGVSTTGDGGLVSVVSTDSPTYSTIQYDAKGGSKIGDNTLKLGQHFITSLSSKPILVTDGMGDTALVEKAIDAGQIAVVSGPASQPGDLSFAGSPPQAAAFAGKILYIAASAPGPMMPNLFIVDVGAPTTPVRTCVVTDDTAMPLSAVAVATTSDKVWVWSKSGNVFAYDQSALGACTATTPIAVAAGTTFTPAAAFVPGTGSQMHVVQDATHQYAVLVGSSQTSGEVQVVDLKASPPAAVGSPMVATGVLSSTIASFDAMTYVVLGFPQNPVKNVNAGEVQIFDFDPTSGTLGTTPVESLSDAQPDSGELFGRDVTTMQFNGKTVLVIAASNEVFSYYRTTLYPTDTRNPPP
ncbi:MAG: hypothetical protein JO257_12525 [Deltaproteobacteria bacterium]|nr:hypothetical protein [Deltaproteobacteria bacterium]